VIKETRLKKLIDNHYSKLLATGITAGALLLAVLTISSNPQDREC
jgi:hypothetical protein